jgi:hypothetical protein
MNNIPTHLSPTRQFWKAIIYALGLTVIVCLLSLAAFGGYRKYPPIPPPATAPATKPISHAAPKFIVGFCQVPVENIPVIKALGGNTCVGIPANRDPVDWARKMTDAEIYQVRPPVGVKELDEDNQYWIALENQDEPDLHGTPLAEIKANHDLAAKLGMPTFTNVDGSRLLGIQAPAPGTDYQAIIDNSDWLGSDVYPVAGWSLNISIWTPGQASDKLLEMGKGKPVLQYIECSKQMQWRQSTVAEMQLIQRQATSRNLRGVIYFTFDFQSPNLGWNGAPSHFFNVDAEHCVEIAQFAERQAK